MKTNDNNSDILVVKLHGVAEVMNENKQLAAKRAQSSGGMDPNNGSRGRNNNVSLNQPEIQVTVDSTTNSKRPDSFQNKFRSGGMPQSQASIVQ